MQAYGNDLAYIHHTAYGGFARDAAPGILKMLHRLEIRGLVVDLGCGSGIWARELLQAGYEVFGIDISAAMIDLARQNAPAAKFQCGSLLDAEIPACAAVTALGECVNYAFDPQITRRALPQLFARVYRALESGGLFLFDAAGPGRLGDELQVHRWIEGEDWAMLLHAEEDTNQLCLTRRIVTFRKTDELYRRSEEVHRLNLYHPADLSSMLRVAGFQVRTVPAYGDTPVPRGLTVFAARKPLG
jgi:SAM-dependent methyltransferase